MLTQKRLREVLKYDSITGEFTWTKGDRKGRVAGTKHDARGFLKVAVDGQRHFLHHLTWLAMTGLLPRWNVEHIDGDHSNNRWSNLIEGDRLQPAPFRAPMPEPTGLNGAFRTGETFTAMIPAEGVVLNLGTFATAKEASAAAIGAVQRARAKHRAGLRG